MRRKSSPPLSPVRKGGYVDLLGGLTELLEQARHAAARSVNAVLTATYWEVGRRVMEYEQRGEKRADYGAALLKRLSSDLTARFGRGFSERNLEQMRLFYLGWPIPQTLSAKSQHARISRGQAEKSQTVSAEFPGVALSARFPLSWSHYVRLLSVENPEARAFYETEALRGGWSVRQLDRQVSTLYYERTGLSRDKASMLRKGNRPKPGEEPTPEEEIKDPLILEFLGLRDEYSESVLEEALIRHLEHFLLELGNDFTFVARQKRLRVGDEWYRIDLLFFHRRLRCLVIIDLKIGKFSHADAGQMNLYLNYAREQWTHPDENPPVGLILCAKGDEAVAHYALGGLSNKVFASRYKLQLPDPKILKREIEAERRRLERGQLMQAKRTE